MCDRRREEVRAWSKQRNFGIDLPINKLEMNNDVSNVEPQEELVKKRGDLSDDISNVSYRMFQFNDNIIEYTGSTRSRGERAGRGSPSD